MSKFKNYKEVYSLIIEDSSSLRAVWITMVVLIALNAIMGSLSVGVIVPLFQSMLDPSILPSMLSNYNIKFDSLTTEQLLNTFFVLVLVLFFFKFIVIILSEYVSAYFKEKLRIVWVERIERGYLSGEYSKVVSINQGERMHNLLREPFNAANCVKFFVESIMSLTIVIGIWITTLYVNWKVSIVISVIAVLLGLLQRKLFFNKALGLGEERVKQWQKVTSQISEVMSMLREIKILNYENIAVIKTKKLMYKLGDLVIKSTVLTTVPRASAEFITVIFFVFGYLLITSSYDIDIKEIMPYMLFFVVAFGKIISASFQFITSVLRVLNNLPSLQLMHQIHASFEENNCSDLKQLQISEIESAIDFNNINFSYQDKLIFNDFNLTIPNGSITFLVGPSGSGKTTLVDLLCGLYHPDSGEIMINHVSLDKYAVTNWRKIVGYVSQEDNLIKASIEDNIKMNNAAASESDVEWAAEIAGIHDYIQKQKNKYKTNVGENGISLSGGQKKRIAIARALINKPKIVIFDEATSNIENRIELEILEKLKAQDKNSITIIVITHRLTNINLADNVFVLNNGSLLTKNDYSSIYSEDEVILLNTV